MCSICKNLTNIAGLPEDAIPPRNQRSLFPKKENKKVKDEKKKSSSSSSS